MSNIQHFIITRFSCRDKEVTVRHGRDPLKKSEINHRLAVFSLSALPSISGQKEKDFTWIIFIDPALDLKYRRKLQSICSNTPQIKFLEYQPEQYLGKLDWLKPHIKTGTDYVVTSMIDDDDFLYNSFTQDVKNYLKSKETIPSLLFIACKNVVQWDFFYSRKSPLGYIKPWTRTQNLPVTPGFSICVKYPELNLSVFTCHSPDFQYLRKYARNELLPQGKHERVEECLKSFGIAYSESGLSWEGNLHPEKQFILLPSCETQVIMTNHFRNVQPSRFFEGLELREPFIPANFSCFCIEPNMIQHYLLKHKPTFFTYTKTTKKRIHLYIYQKNKHQKLPKLTEIFILIKSTLTHYLQY